MGEIENVTQELESSIAEPSKEPPSLSEDPNKQKMGSLTSATETAVNVEVNEAKNVENDSFMENLEKGEVEPNREASLEKVDGQNFKAVTENAKVAVHQNGQTDGNMGISPGFAPARSGSELLYTVHIEEDTGSSRKSRRRNTKVELPVTSSWGLRSKTREKTKSPDPRDSAKESNGNEEKKRRGRKKKQINKTTAVNEFSRARTHLRYLLHRIKFEQNLIDAYSAEGWKGQSVEKLKPEKELERAKSHILRYKLRIRALFQQIDQSLGAGKLPATLFDAQGEIDSEDIFCAKCGSKDLTLDNDIILCDGACERGFHQFCLEPPLLKEHIPPGDEGWLCPGCDCKLDCIDMLKDFHGTNITITDNWEKIFPDAAAAASGNKLLDGSMSASDDSEDDDYDPNKPDNDEAVGEEELNSEDETSSDESSCSSASDGLVPTQIKEKCLELPSDDSEDDDFDPSAVEQDKQEEKQDSSTSDFSSDSEDLGALLEDDPVAEADSGNNLLSSDQRHPSTGSGKRNAKVGRKKRESLTNEVSHIMETVDAPVSGRRHVERLDYKKLNDEAYGNSSSDSSDEDFHGDEDSHETAAHKRRRTSRVETAAVSPNKSPMAMSTPNANDEVLKGRNHSSKRTQKQSGSGFTNESSKDGSASANAKKSTHRRLGEAVTQRLYASFSQNQYLTKEEKENLAKELGLEVKQVAKWFDNTRWNFNHKPQKANSAEKPSTAVPTTSMNNMSSTPPVQQPQEQSAANTPLVDHKTTTREQPIVITSSSENSGTVKPKKRKGKSKQTPAGTTVTNGTVDQKSAVNTPPPRRTSMRRRSGSSIP